MSKQSFYLNDKFSTLSSLGKSFKYDFNYLKNSIKRNNLVANEKNILEAFKLCYELYNDQKYVSGSYKYTHSLEVALIIIEELKIRDSDTIIAAILHNVLINIQNIDIDFLEKNTSKEIVNLIVGVTEIANIDKKNNKAEIYRKLFLAIIKDIRVFIIKLADRLHILRTLQYLPQKQHKEIAEETLNFFAPFAHRLGLQKLKNEIEARSFYSINTTQYEQILEFLADKKKLFSEYMFTFIYDFRNVLDEVGVPYKLKGVHKQEYEIFLMLQDGKKLEDIDNLFSLVVVLKTENEEECYNVYKALADKFKISEVTDYISKPHTDWYRSLNMKLHNPNGSVEIIIRTQFMQDLSEYGIGKLLTRKQSSCDILQVSEEGANLWNKWMKHIIETKGEQASQIIWNSIKNNILDKKITVFTKNKEAKIILPENSTLIDFAFSTSLETGIHAVTGKVNNVVKNIFTKLEDGDEVEIITSNKCYPDSSWLKNIVFFKSACYLTDYFKTNYNLKTKQKNIIFTKKEFTTINITGIERNGLLTEIKKKIGLENIYRIRLFPCTLCWEIAIDIKTQEKDVINKYFLELFKIHGIKSVLIS